MRNLPMFAALALQFLLFAGCHEAREDCTPRTVDECTCDDGEDGFRYCLANGRYESCFCEDSDPWTQEPPTRFDAGLPGDDFDPDDILRPFDAGSILDPFFRDAGRDAGPTSPPDGKLLSTGLGALIDVFALGDDVWVILPNRVARLSLDDGTELVHWDAPRPLLTAAFDGERLAVLDGAKLTMLDKSALTVGLSANLIEPCKSAILMKGGPLVCSPGDYSTRAYVIDTVSGAQQSSSAALRPGKLMEVPGTRRFFSADTSSSSFAQPFELTADGGVQPASDAGLLGSTSVSLAPPLGFDAVPAENVITRQGVLLRMNATCGSSAEPCFARTGTLGLLSAQEAFLAMESASGDLFGLLDPGGINASSSARCGAQPCRLLRIDVAAREIRAEQLINHPLRSVIAMRILPDRTAAVLGVGKAGTDPYYSSSADAGYEVVRVEMKPKP